MINGKVFGTVIVNLYFQLMERELNSKQILAEMELRLSQPTASQPFNPGSVHEIETIPVDLSSVFNSNPDGSDSEGRNSMERDPDMNQSEGGQGGSDRMPRNSKGAMQTTQLSDIDENLSESSNSVQLWVKERYDSYPLLLQGSYFRDQMTYIFK